MDSTASDGTQNKGRINAERKRGWGDKSRINAERGPGAG
jgi:hypothetical protein